MFQARFVRKEKSFVKNVWDQKERSSKTLVDFPKGSPLNCTKRPHFFTIRLISNRPNFDLLAPKSMHFPSNDRKLERIFLFNLRNFSRAIFPFSHNALESLYCSVILTASFGQFCCSFTKHTSFTYRFRS